MEFSTSISHELWMQRALTLASLGKNYVRSNPMVGAVIVHNDRIIGEGWHRAIGGPHAEVEAVRAVKDKSLLKDSVLYVTLEPCNHFGKTPPCTQLILETGIPKVVVACTDPNPRVSGSGILLLKEKGITVLEGILEKEAQKLNERFFCMFQKKRPFIVLKWAETSDGFIARKNYDSKWISSERSRQWVHRWRAEEMGIWVGYRTAIQDNPSLNVRDWIGTNPIRICHMRNADLPKNLHLNDNSQETLFYYSEGEGAPSYEYFEKNRLDTILSSLALKGCVSILVEGGATLLSDLIKLGFWDEIRVFKSKNKAFLEGISAPTFNAVSVKTIDLGEDILTYYRPIKY